MKKFVLFFLFLSSHFIVSAQLNPNSVKSQDELDKVLPGKLFTQLASSLKTSSFQNSFLAKRKTFIETAKKGNEGPALAANISALTENIKPEMFKTGFSSKALTQQATGAKSVSQAIGLLKGLEAGLKPEALTDVWKMQKSNWISEINRLM